jgi:hypothetical protein
MAANDIFGESIPIAALSEGELRTWLAAAGDTDALALLNRDPGRPGGRPESFALDGLSGLLDALYPYRRVTHVTGFFAVAGPIMPASRAGPPLAPNTRVRVLLDRLHVYRYPGSGTHEILIEATLGDTIDGAGKLAHFARKLSMKPGASGPVGWPFFEDVTLSETGMLLAFQSVNLGSSFEKGLLKVFDDDAFKLGLSLVEAAVPATAQTAKLVRGLVEWTAKQSENAVVQQAQVGLDYRLPGAPGARLSAGTYVFIQLPQNVANLWQFDEWEWNSDRETIVNRATNEPIEANFLAISVVPQA